MTKKTLFIALGVGMIVLLAFLAKVALRVPDTKSCTLEARVCPDGSYVGRTGPDCEFASCPGGE